MSWNGQRCEYLSEWLDQMKQLRRYRDMCSFNKWTTLDSYFQKENDCELGPRYWGTWSNYHPIKCEWISPKKRWSIMWHIVSRYCENLPLLNSMYWFKTRELEKFREGVTTTRPNMIGLIALLLKVMRAKFMIPGRRRGILLSSALIKWENLYHKPLPNN